jgi:hypothetical protein
MRDRWLRIGGLAAGLFVINIVARAVSHFAFKDDGEAQDRVSLAMFAAIGIVLAVLAFLWGRRRHIGEVVGDLGGGALLACALTILVGPLIFGGNPFGGGAGEFFSQIWLYAAFSVGGVILGYLFLVALGRDYRSRQLARIASTRAAKPRRVVRR